MKLARWAKVAFTTAKFVDEKLIFLKSPSKRSTVNILVSLSDSHRERLCFTQFSTGIKLREHRLVVSDFGSSLAAGYVER